MVESCLAPASVAELEFVRQPRRSFSFPSRISPVPSQTLRAPGRIRGVPFPIRGVPFPIRGVPFPIRGVPFLIRGVPFAIRGVPFPIRGVPFPIRGVSFLVRGVPDRVSPVPERTSGVPPSHVHPGCLTTRSSERRVASAVFGSLFLPPSLSLGPLGALPLPLSLAGTSVPVRFVVASVSRSLCLHVCLSGESLALFSLSRRQRPHSPAGGRSVLRSPDSQVTRLTTRSSERRGGVHRFCLAFSPAVAELGSVRRSSSPLCVRQASLFPFASSARLFSFASWSRFAFRGRRSLRSAFPGGSAHHSPAGGKSVLRSPDSQVTRLTTRSSERRGSVRL